MLHKEDVIFFQFLMYAHAGHYTVAYAVSSPIPRNFGKLQLKCVAKNVAAMGLSRPLN